MNLDKLRIFYYAAMAKSFTNCGLHLSPSVISRHVSDLEFWLKAKLFVRRPKGMSLTPEGQKLLDKCHSVFRELEDIRSFISPDTKEVEGPIKVTTPSGWVANIVVGLVKNFLKENPAVRLIIKSFDGVPDFSRSEADVALLPYVPDDDVLMAKKVMDLNLGLYASPEYLQEYGIPKTASDLDHHRLISYGDHDHPLVNINWHLKLGRGKKDPPREPYLTVSNLYHAAEAGYGVATLAKENILLREERLVHILKDIKGPKIEAFCVFPKRLEKSKRINAFVHYVRQAAKEYLVIEAL